MRIRVSALKAALNNFPNFVTANPHLTPVSSAPHNAPHLLPKSTSCLTLGLTLIPSYRCSSSKPSPPPQSPQPSQSPLMDLRIKQLLEQGKHKQAISLQNQRLNLLHKNRQITLEQYLNKKIGVCQTALTLHVELSEAIANELTQKYWADITKYGIQTFDVLYRLARLQFDAFGDMDKAEKYLKICLETKQSRQAVEDRLVVGVDLLVIEFLRQNYQNVIAESDRLWSMYNHSRDGIKLSPSLLCGLISLSKITYKLQSKQTGTANLLQISQKCENNLQNLHDRVIVMQYLLRIYKGLGMNDRHRGLLTKYVDIYVARPQIEQDYLHNLIVGMLWSHYDYHFTLSNYDRILQYLSHHDQKQSINYFHASFLKIQTLYKLHSLPQCHSLSLSLITALTSMYTQNSSSFPDPLLQGIFVCSHIYAAITAHQLQMDKEQIQARLQKLGKVMKLFRGVTLQEGVRLRGLLNARGKNLGEIVAVLKLNLPGDWDKAERDEDESVRLFMERRRVGREGGDGSDF